MTKSITAAATVALLLAGCASVEGDFPSLSKRPYETGNPVDVPAATPAPLTTALPADLKTRTDALVARGRQAHLAFEAALPAVRAASQSASGAAPGSEAWVNAHMILSRADGARSDGVAALGDMDQLIARERDKGADPGLIALLAEPQGQLAAIVNQDTAEINRLANLIGL
jgi:hypothetical protein